MHVNVFMEKVEACAKENFEYHELDAQFENNPIW